MSNASRVSAGGWNSAYGHTCAVTSAGGIRCWGENQNGQLGNGGTVDSTTPVTVTGLSGLVNVVAAGGEHTCASTTGGAAQCWGDNVSGQLGDSTKNDSSTPVNVSGLSSGVTAIATGFRHTCAVVGGAVRCWGRNQYGQLGNAGTTESSAPVSVSGISNGATVVAAGAEHSCAVVSGGAKCWGYGGSGQLGNGDTTNSSVPVDVSGLGAVSAISVGDHHTCALTTGGGVKCWGENGYGQLGNGDDADSSTPVDVTGLTSGVTAITAGGDHTCAVTGGGAVKCWGYNSFSQIGDGAIVYHTEPQELTINVYPTLFAPVVLTDR